jgi:hypothetical protein
VGMRRTFGFAREALTGGASGLALVDIIGNE